MSLGTGVTENVTRKEDLQSQASGCELETGKSNYIGGKVKGITPTSGKEGKGGHGAQDEALEVMQWEIGTLPGESSSFDFKMAPNTEGILNVKA